MDGEFLLAGGKSKYICIYNVKEEMLVKRFEISQNKSFDGIDVTLNISFSQTIVKEIIIFIRETTIIFRNF